MAKKQTRKSISVSRELYTRAKAFAAAHGIPVAQLATQGIEALLGTALPLQPAIAPSLLGYQTQLGRGMPVGHPPVPGGRATFDRSADPPRVIVPREAFERQAALRRAGSTPEQLAAAAVDRGLSAVVPLPVSDVVLEAVGDQVARGAPDSRAVIEAGLNRMLDAVEAEARAGAFCRNCCESELCRCNGHRQVGPVHL